jgi:hypothetical protein
MSEASTANFELSLVLPLGVIANQLMKVEADLRFLNAKTSAYAGERLGSAVAVQLAAQLEKIHAALEAIRALVAEVETDIQPKPAGTKALKARTELDD